MQLETVGLVQSPYLTKFGVPRQPGLVTALTSRIIFKPEHRRTLAELGLAVSSPVCVLWGFSYNASEDGRWSKTVRPPILGGVERMGVFATRSSFRPNNLALSIMRIADIEEDAISLRGGDMVDGTPVYAVMPCAGQLPCGQAANSGWVDDVSWPMLEDVFMPEEAAVCIPAAKREGIRQVLIQDPRPAYTRQGQEEREFWTAIDRYIIWFTVAEKIMHVTRVHAMDQGQIDKLKKTGNVPI